MAFTSDATLQRREGTRAGSTVFSGGGTAGGSGIEVIILDASDGNTTQQLPDPSVADTALALRTDSTANTATLEDPNGTDIERRQEDDVSSIIFLPEEARLFVSDDSGSFWTEVRQPLSAAAEAVTADDQLNDSPPLKLQANYDGSGTQGDGTVTPTTSDFEITHVPTDAANGNTEAQISFDGTTVGWITDDGGLFMNSEIEAFASGSGSSGGSSGLAANDPISIDTTPDPDEVNFIMDVRETGQAAVVEGPTELRFTGSGVNGVTNPSGSVVEVDISGGGSASSLSDLGDVDSATQADGNVIASGGGNYRQESFSSLAGNHLSLSDLSSAQHGSLSGVSSDDHHVKYTDADAQTAINNDADHGSTAPHNYFSGSHTDLTNVNPNDHHIKPSTGDGLTGTDTFAVDDTVARTDRNETFEEAVGIQGEQVTFFGTLGNSGGESLRLAGSASDAVFSIQGGGGRYKQAWNARFDGTAAEWQYISGGEPASLIAMQGGDIGPGGTTPSFTVGIAGNGTAGTVITWARTLQMTEALGLQVSGDSYGDGDNIFQLSAHRPFTFRRRGSTDAGAALSLEADTGNPIEFRDGSANVHFRYEPVDAHFGFGGITSPAFTIHAQGDIRGTGEVEAFRSSDERLKKEIKPLEQGIGFGAYTFQWDDPNRPDKSERGRVAGLLAQEVEEVFPSAVSKDQYGNLQIDPMQVIALLVHEINTLKAKQAK